MEGSGPKLVWGAQVEEEGMTNTWILGRGEAVQLWRCPETCAADVEATHLRRTQQVSSLVFQALHPPHLTEQSWLHWAPPPLAPLWLSWSSFLLSGPQLGCGLGSPQSLCPLSCWGWGQVGASVAGMPPENKQTVSVMGLRRYLHAQSVTGLSQHI